MPHPYANHEIARELSAVPRGKLEAREVDRRLNSFLQRYADIAYSTEDAVGLGRRFPYLGDCLAGLQWSQEAIFVAYTGRHNLVVAGPEAWPDYPCRQLSQEEYYEVMRPLTEAYYTSLRTDIGSDQKQEDINASLGRLFRYVQQLRIP